MKQRSGEITVATRGAGLTDCTRALADFVAASGIRDGLCTIFIRHTSASLVIQENADPDVLTDLQNFFRKLVPEDMGGDGRLYVHTAEGPDDMPAHIKAALTATQLSIPVTGGRLMLGTWQGVYVFEHRRTPHRRKLALHIIGD